MKQITINGKTYKPKGLARTLDQDCVWRAMANERREGFNEKFKNPRSIRLGASIKP